MEISLQKIKQSLGSEDLEETRSEKIDDRSIVEQFWTFMKAGEQGNH
jgi:hypothetical protein